MIRLGVNIDHVATLRQQRGTVYPDICHAAELAVKGGADQITVHLREDRRHIQDQDVIHLMRMLKVPLNLEMAVAEPIVEFALKTKPAWACLVPEKREELTTEGGLNVKVLRAVLANVIPKLKKNGTKVSLFIEPDVEVVHLSKDVGADAVEIHTGTYCNLDGAKQKEELQKIEEAAKVARELKMGAHAGHGLDYETTKTLVSLKTLEKIPLIEEYNIGHFLICKSIEVGLVESVSRMKTILAGG